jgi:hypothetical protein
MLAHYLHSAPTITERICNNIPPLSVDEQEAQVELLMQALDKFDRRYVINE